MAGKAGSSRLLTLLVMAIVVVGALWGSILGLGLKPQLGLDLQGGLSAVLIPKAGQGPIDQEVLDQTVTTIRQRVDALGVAEPEITRQGDTIQVQLPGVVDQQKARDVIGRTAQLQFRPVLEVFRPSSSAPGAGPRCDQRRDVTVPPSDETVVLCLRPKTEGNEPTLPQAQWNRLLVGPVAVSGADVTDARAVPGQSSLGLWEVALEFNGAGGERFKKLTADLACQQPFENPRRQIAIVLDGVVESALPPAIEVQCNVGIEGGARINVRGGQQEAKELAAILRAGALPIELEFGTFQTVSPTLGRSSLQAGLLAGGIGLVLVAAYLIALYRGIGFAAVSELAVFGLMVYGIVIVLGAVAGFTLTLAGIAGIIVSIGIAADSSIIYRERFRDEIRAGRTIRTAADVAFNRALRTNLTGNTVSFLAAAVLYVLAVGPVRGFAFTLGLSTLVDTLVFSTYTGALFGLIARNPKLARSPLMGLRAGVAPVAAGREA